MKVLVVGGGGREHALVWTLSRSPRVKTIYCAPGNGGTDGLAVNVPVPAHDVEGLIRLVREFGIDWTVVGPEDPLAGGIVDRFREEGLRIFGPTAKAAAIEASKDLAKALMARSNIPTAASRTFDQAHRACAFVRSEGRSFVVKADGLAAGKGVVVAQSVDETCRTILDMLEEKTYGQAGTRVLVEEILEGPEISVLAFSDGQTVIPMPWSQDHKRLLDHDRGPNTGGMGAYSPPRYVTKELEEEILETILKPVVETMAREGTPYQGVLYAGLMLTREGPKVLEFNARFGDPEAQVILMRLETDFVDIMEAVEEKRLHELDIRWSPDATAGVVMASAGYPGGIETGRMIRGLESVQDGTMVFHGGTRKEEGRTVTSGGRVLTVCGRGRDLQEAVARAYSRVESISFEGAQYRTDIAWRSLK